MLASSCDDGLREAVTGAKKLARDAVERRGGVPGCPRGGGGLPGGGNGKWRVCRSLGALSCVVRRKKHKSREGPAPRVRASASTESAECPRDRVVPPSMLTACDRASTRTPV